MNPTTGKKLPKRFNTGFWICLLILALLLAAAWNTGANLLYMVLGMVASFLILSILMERLTMRNVSLQRSCPHAVYRGDTAAVAVRLINHKSLLPAVSLRIERASDGNTRRRGPSLAYIVQIPPQCAADLAVQEIFNRRGVYTVPPYDLVTSFPFGLTERRRRYADQAEITVYPRVRPVRTRILEQAQGGHLIAQRAVGDGDEYFALREYEAGDEIRLIAWRLSARLGVWMVREMSIQTTRRIAIVLDTRNGESDDFENRFEEAVELCASLAVSLLQKQYQVAISTPAISIPAAEGSAQHRKILEILARVQPVPAADFPGFEHTAVSREMLNARVLFISPHPHQWGQLIGAHSLRALDPSTVIYA